MIVEECASPRRSRAWSAGWREDHDAFVAAAPDFVTACAAAAAALGADPAHLHTEAF